MSLTPWREIAKPHRDVLEGSFKQSEFAADITRVATGAAAPEYQNAETFFARTCITEGMRLLLISLARRLAGQGGDPVIQLQTAFGGGKTHTMLAVLHLASRKAPADRLEGIPPLLDEAGIHELPAARVAVLDGIDLALSQGKKHGRQTANTLWGEMAWQLLGPVGYELLAASDRDGTSPGKEVLAELLGKAAPCVVLIDELLRFFSQFEPGKRFRAGTYESNLAAIQALTEAMKMVPGAVLFASLPDSDTEAGGDFGQQALVALEKLFARVESVWKPVATEEAFEIVRRRLFEHAGDSAQVEDISRQFTNFYRKHASRFPVETQSNEYFERLCSSYPIHPEIFDRLYGDWSTLDKFQRTRGVLQYLAVIIHRLWNENNQDALIMPGSIPLDDSVVRQKSLQHLPQGWEPVIETEVDGPRAETHFIDGEDTRFGSVQAAHRTMRTVFLGSAPSVSDQVVKGIQSERILLGAVQPGQTIGVFEDVLKRLRDRLHYLYSDQERLWLDTRPNLRREMESRKQLVDNARLYAEVKQRVQRVFASKHRFSGIHVFTPSGDVPDEYGTGPRLVVLSLEHGYSRAASSATIEAAESILQSRGEQPRQKRNRLIFLAPDHDVISRLKDAGRTCLAWLGIVADMDDGRLNLDLYMAKQARKNAEAAGENLRQLVREAWKWLLCPHQDNPKDKKVNWEAVSVSTNAQNLVKEIETRLKEEEWLVSKWSPVHLKSLLDQWYFKDGAKQVNALKVWQDTCHYLYLPRLVDDQVYKDAITQGLESEDFFGYAPGMDGDRYLGFCFGRGGIVMLEGSAVLVEREEAANYRARTRSAEQPDGESTPGKSTTASPGVGDAPQGDEEGKPALKRRFYGTVKLEPLKARVKFPEIDDEVIRQFTSTGVNVSISVEIQARSQDGFDESLQRTVKENSNTLNFESAEFED